MIINSLLDNDLYKFTMMQAAFHNFPGAIADYEFVLRSKGVDLRPYRRDIELEIDHLCSLKFVAEDLDYLSTLLFIKGSFLNFLEDFRLKRRDVLVYEKEGALRIRISGSWVHTILYEVPLMAIISETYLKDKGSKTEAFAKGLAKIKENVALIKKSDSSYTSGKSYFKFADFGTRRRYSQEWHDKVVETYKELVPKNIVGTSNIYLARKHDLSPIGTMAHEWLQAGQGIGSVPLAKSQQFMLETWVKEYRGDLGIALSDTINMSAFLKDFDSYFSKLYDGVRHDSADPYVWGDRMIAHYKKLKINPKTKSLVFSDGLNFAKALEISKYFFGKANISFGIGTKCSNDVGIDALSMVIKMIFINNNPVAKISDEPAKAICKDPEFLSYLKKVYFVKV